MRRDCGGAGNDLNLHATVHRIEQADVRKSWIGRIAQSSRQGVGVPSLSILNLRP
jgi:hypothetical protein